MPAQTPSNVELCLLAPYNEEVALISSWNQWQRQPMTKGDDGWWRISAQLPDGEHFYKFAVKSKSYFALDQWKEVFDPYGLSITNDELERTALIIKDGQRSYVDYQWRHDDVPLPQNEELVLYEVHVGDFTGGLSDGISPRIKGKFRGLIQKLDYLADLGINAIELMPVKEFPGKSWGYNIRSLFAVDSSYGSPSELCELVDECHGRGIRVIIDGVYNHADADAPLAQIDYQYWFYRENPDPKEMQWGPKYDFTHYDEKLKIFPARKYVIESIHFWMEQFHIDGLRFDATRAIKDFTIMREFTDALFERNAGRKPFFTVAEHVPEDPAIVGYPARGPMIAAWHDSFAKQLQAIATQHDRDGAHPWDLDALQQKMNPATNGYQTGNHVVNYIVSHDHERILKQVADATHALGESAFRRVKLAMGLLMTSPGLPMIWMGQEFGATNPKTLSPQPIDWNLLTKTDNRQLHDYTSTLVKFRKSSATLRNDHFHVVLKDKDRHLFGYKRWDDAGGVVLVIANLNDAPMNDVVVQDVSLKDGAWHEIIFNYDAQVQNATLKEKLGPSEVKIFVKN